MQAVTRSTIRGGARGKSGGMAGRRPLLTDRPYFVRDAITKGAYTFCITRHEGLAHQPKIREVGDELAKISDATSSGTFVDPTSETYWWIVFPLEGQVHELARIFARLYCIVRGVDEHTLSR